MIYSQSSYSAIRNDYRAQDMAFEIVDMNPDGRSKLRRLLADNLSSSGTASAEADTFSASAETSASAGSLSR
jgi:hypothetical protein